MSRFFINRPIFAGVVAIIMVLAGSLAIPVLPVEQYPQITPPTVQVRAIYPGASAETVSNTVASPIEQEINGVEGMIYMSSVSSDGGYSLTVTFELGTDLDLASVRVQNRVAVAEPRLPEEVRRQGITTKKQSTSLLMVLAPHSPDGRYDQLYLSNYVTLFMKDALARVNGVGEVTVFGAKDYAMRVWLDPGKLASRRLTTVDVINALREQNVQVAAGRIGAEPTDDPSGFQITLETKGRLSTVEEFESIILKVGEDQRTVVLKDIARVELGAQDYDQFARFNGMQSPALGIYQTPGTNALDVSKGVRETLAELARDFPEGMECPVFYDFTMFVEASIEEVVTTLIIASLLVFLTVFVFLQDWRATLIPGAAIPVSIIGTFAILLAMGFSMNMLTLFGLILAIGIVVDDAIVVVENTQRLIDEEDLDSKEAARRSMQEITGPVVATTLVLLAVFLPTAVLPGITGELYRQFGVTLSVATILSSVNALTLSPALCGILLRKGKTRRLAPFRAFNTALDGSRSVYLWAVRKALRIGVVTVILFVAIVLATVHLFRTVPTGFLPSEDQSFLFVNVQLPDAAKLNRTDSLMQTLEEEMLATDGVSGVVSIGGYSFLSNASLPNAGTFVVILDPWEQRTTPDTSIDAIVGALSGKFAAHMEAIVFPFVPPPIQGLGRSGGFDMQIQDRAGAGPQQLAQAAQDIIAETAADTALTQAYTGFSAEVPKLFVDIDRVKVKRLGVPLTSVFDTLQSQMGGTYVNDFNLFGRVYQVRAQADSEFRQRVREMLNLEVRNDQGRTIPLLSFTEVRPTAGPSVIYRYNLYPAASITGAGAPGVSSGQAANRMERIASQTLPQGFGFEWTGMTYQEKEAGNVAPIAFSLAIVFVFLFLAAQYESWITPLAILATVPIGVLGALALTGLLGLPNNIYTQIGLVLLIALVSKNAILIVEFAEQRRQSGENILPAAETAAGLRFRPILMTSFSFVLGTLPLLIATGAGANSRRAIGTAVFGGMVLVTIVGVFFIPTMYALIRQFAALFKRKPTDQSA